MKKKKIADKKRTARQQKTEESSNPFEVKCTRKKRDVLGVKPKTGRFSGYSNTELVAKRKDRLSSMLEQRTKQRKFVDNRIGEYDESLSTEDKMLQRFAIEKKKHHSATAYQLEDHELTHLGQSLSEIENFQSDRKFSSDEDDDDTYKDRNDKEESDLYFGGFLKKKSGTSSEDIIEHGKSKKEVMEEIITKSKMKKLERQRESERTENMRLGIDKEWKTMLPMLTSAANRGQSAPQGQSNSYDKAVQELAYDQKAKATNRLKSAEEIAKEERDKLERLEADRVRRMKGLPKTNESAPHLSADALTTNVEQTLDSRIMLSYKDGKPVIPEGYSEAELLPKGTLEGGDKEESSNEDEASSDVSDEDQSEETTSEEEDSGNDLNSSEGSCSDELEDQEKAEGACTKPNLEAQEVVDKTMEEAKEELPYHFPAPSSYSDFESLLIGRSLEEHLIIIDRIRTLYHPSLNPAYHSNMEALLRCLLQHLENVVSEHPNKLINSGFIDGIIKHTYEVAQLSQKQTASCFLNFLNKHVNEFKRKGSKVVFPGLHQLVFFRLVAIIFPTTDFCHCIATPTLLYMGRLLNECVVESIMDVLKGLFICNTMLEYVSVSKRFIPEAIVYLTNVISSVSDLEGGKWRELLHVGSIENIEIQDMRLEWLASANYFAQSDDSIRLSALALAFYLLDKFSDLYCHMTAFPEAYSRINELLESIDIDRYPEVIKASYEEIQKRISSTASKPRKYLTLQQRKPQPLKLLEPKFSSSTGSDSKRSYGEKKRIENIKNERKAKQDKKRLTRELRRDNRMLSMRQLDDQRKRDAERKRKVKDIEHMLANEQAEVKAEKRKKRR